MTIRRTQEGHKREKIELGGLIVKAGLRYEKRALLLGAADRCSVTVESRATMPSNRASRR
jgi:hypothetical protein